MRAFGPCTWSGLPGEHVHSQSRRCISFSDSTAEPSQASLLLYSVGYEPLPSPHTPGKELRLLKESGKAPGEPVRWHILL